MTVGQLKGLVVTVLVAVTVMMWGFVGWAVSAQPPLPTASVPTVPPSPPATPVPAAVNDPALLTLQAVNQQAQRDMDRLIGLVGAALGALVTIAALLVAAQFLFSMRVYEHDKRMLLDDLKAAVSQIMSDRGTQILLRVREERGPN